jgi:outer membrane protein assembly factor BamB
MATFTPWWELQWGFWTNRAIYSSPAIAGSSICVGCNDGALYAVDTRSGKKRWEFTTGGPVESSPTVSGGMVIFRSGHRNLYAVGG